METAEEQQSKQHILAGYTVGGKLGTFSVDFTIWNPDRTQSSVLTGLVDTRVLKTVVPAQILDDLAIEKRYTEGFILSDGSRQELAIGWVEMKLQGETRYSHIVFGPDPDTIILGSMTLTVFALAADSENLRLIPGLLLLASPMSCDSQ